MLHLARSGVDFEALKHDRLLFHSQKLAVLGPWANDEYAGDCDDNSDEALDDKNPTPTFIATYAIHLDQQISQKSAECTCQYRCAKEKRITQLEFMALIVGADEACATYNVSGLSWSSITFAYLGQSQLRKFP